MPLRHRLIALLGALMLAAAACGGGAASDLDASASASAVAVADTAEAADAAAPSGPDLGILDQGSLEGQDVVVWFWAEW